MAPGGVASKGELLWLLPGKFLTAKVTIDSSALVDGVA